jgi:hypothetical protein
MSVFQREQWPPTTNPHAWSQLLGAGLSSRREILVSFLYFILRPMVLWWAQLPVGDFLLRSIHLQLGYVCLCACSCFPVDQRLDAVGRALCDFFLVSSTVVLSQIFVGVYDLSHTMAQPWFLLWVLGSVNRSFNREGRARSSEHWSWVVGSHSGFSSWLLSCDFSFKLQWGLL